MGNDPKAARARQPSTTFEVVKARRALTLAAFRYAEACRDHSLSGDDDASLTNVATAEVRLEAAAFAYAEVIRGK